MLDRPACVSTYPRRQASTSCTTSRATLCSRWAAEWSFSTTTATGSTTYSSRTCDSRMPSTATMEMAPSRTWPCRRGLDDPLSETNGGCAADYDNDGDQDLYTTIHGANKLFRNDGTGVFEDVSEALIDTYDDKRRFSGCAWGDYDTDGNLDLIVVSHSGRGRRGPPDPQGLRYSTEGAVASSTTRAASSPT